VLLLIIKKKVFRFQMFPFTAMLLILSDPIDSLSRGAPGNVTPNVTYDTQNFL